MVCGTDFVVSLTRGRGLPYVKRMTVRGFERRETMQHSMLLKTSTVHFSLFASLSAAAAANARRLDPGQEWLCDVVVLQSEAQWAAQLRASKDVVAQSMAVQVGGCVCMWVRECCAHTAMLTPQCTSHPCAVCFVLSGQPHAMRARVRPGRTSSRLPFCNLKGP